MNAFLSVSEPDVPLRPILLVMASFLVLSALLVLLVEARSSATIEVPEEALAQARARYTRAQAQRPAPPAPLPTAAARARPTPPTRAAEPDVPPELDEAEIGDRYAELRAQRAAQAAERQRERQDEAVEQREEIRERRERVREYYDQGDYDNALREARELLPMAPNNRYVLRVSVTAACAVEDAAAAAEQYSKLFRDEDRRIVRTRCARYGVDL